MYSILEAVDRSIGQPVEQLNWDEVLIWVLEHGNCTPAHGSTVNMETMVNSRHTKTLVKFQAKLL